VVLTLFLMHAIMLRLESISVPVASAAGKKRYVNNLMKNIFFINALSSVLIRWLTFFIAVYSWQVVIG
jgi:hypothetical protein